MTATKQTIIEKATIYARQVSENSRILVTFHGGCLWLVLTPVPGTSDCSRTLMAVGTPAMGIRYIREQIKNYFEGK